MRSLRHNVSESIRQQLGRDSDTEKEPMQKQAKDGSGARGTRYRMAVHKGTPFTPGVGRKKERKTGRS